MTNFFGGPIFDIDGLYLQLAAAGIVGIDYPGVVAAEVASLLHLETNALWLATSNRIGDRTCQLLVRLAQIDGTSYRYLWGFLTGSRVNQVLVFLCILIEVNLVRRVSCLFDIIDR
jgi:hypothetical protein